MYFSSSPSRSQKEQRSVRVRLRDQNESCWSWDRPSVSRIQGQQSTSWTSTQGMLWVHSRRLITLMLKDRTQNQQKNGKWVFRLKPWPASVSSPFQQHQATPLHMIRDVAQHWHSLQRDLKLQLRILHPQLLQAEKSTVSRVSMRKQSAQWQQNRSPDDGSIPPWSWVQSPSAGCFCHGTSLPPWWLCWPTGWVCGGSNPPSQQQNHQPRHSSPGQHTNVSHLRIKVLQDFRLVLMFWLKYPHTQRLTTNFRNTNLVKHDGFQEVYDCGFMVDLRDVESGFKRCWAPVTASHVILNAPPCRAEMCSWA